MGCTSCKKKKVAQSPEELHSQEITEWNGGQPTWEEIKQAYDDLTSYGGVKPGKHESINKVYQALFGEPFNFGCGGCGSYQAKRFHNYITNAEGKSS
jgi:hypothetical protein